MQKDRPEEMSFKMSVALSLSQEIFLFSSSLGRYQVGLPKQESL